MTKGIIKDFVLKDFHDSNKFSYDGISINFNIFFKNNKILKCSIEGIKKNIDYMNNYYDLENEIFIEIKNYMKEHKNNYMNYFKDLSNTELLNLFIADLLRVYEMSNAYLNGLKDGLNILVCINYNNPYKDFMFSTKDITKNDLEKIKGKYKADKVIAYRNYTDLFIK